MTYSKEIIEEAIKKNDYVLLTKMINDGVDVNSMVIPYHTDVLLLSILRPGHIFIKRVLDAGFKCSEKSGLLYVHHAVRTHDIYKLDLIVRNFNQNNQNLGSTTNTGENPLHIATKEIDIPYSIISYLTDAGVSWEEKNNEGKTPLHIYIENQKILPPELNEVISKNKGLLNTEDNNGVTPAQMIHELKKNKEWLELNKDFLLELNQ